jgi:hypothetical protein
MLKFVLVSFWDIKAVTMQASKTNLILHSSLHRFKGYLREGADMGENMPEMWKSITNY